MAEADMQLQEMQSQGRELALQAYRNDFLRLPAKQREQYQTQGVDMDSYAENILTQRIQALMAQRPNLNQLNAERNIIIGTLEFSRNAYQKLQSAGQGDYTREIFQRQSILDVLSPTPQQNQPESNPINRAEVINALRVAYIAARDRDPKYTQITLGAYGLETKGDLNSNKLREADIGELVFLTVQLEAIQQLQRPNETAVEADANLIRELEGAIFATNSRGTAADVLHAIHTYMGANHANTILTPAQQKAWDQVKDRAANYVEGAERDERLVLALETAISGGNRTSQAEILRTINEYMRVNHAGTLSRAQNMAINFIRDKAAQYVEKPNETAVEADPDLLRNLEGAILGANAQRGTKLDVLRTIHSYMQNNHAGATLTPAQQMAWDEMKNRVGEYVEGAAPGAERDEELVLALEAAIFAGNRNSEANILQAMHNYLRQHYPNIQLNKGQNMAVEFMRSRAGNYIEQSGHAFEFDDRNIDGMLLGAGSPEEAMKLQRSLIEAKKLNSTGIRDLAYIRSLFGNPQTQATPAHPFANVRPPGIPWAGTDVNGEPIFFNTPGFTAPDQLAAFRRNQPRPQQPTLLQRLFGGGEQNNNQNSPQGARGRSRLGR